MQVGEEGERGGGGLIWDLDPGALEADAVEHLRGRGTLRGRRLGAVRKLGAEDLQRREGIVQGLRSPDGPSPPQGLG